MSYETLVKEAQTLTETEKLDLVTFIIKSLKSDKNENDKHSSKNLLSSLKGAFKGNGTDEELREEYMSRKFG